MEDVRLLYLAFTLMSVLNSVVCLECYVCSNQFDNKEKCVRTIMTCEPGEDMCLTEIKWGTMPYWQAGADKQYYISKRCATQSECNRTMAKYLPYCTYIWYEDWKCAQCCAGDKCNYYIINGDSSITSNGFFLAASLIATFLTSKRVT